MAIFLAAIAMGDKPLPIGMIDNFKSIISCAGNVDVLHNERVGLAFCDLLIWQGSSSSSHNSATAVIAGDPLICENDKALLREHSIKRMLEITPLNVVDNLSKAEGTYCGVVIDEAANNLIAFTDKLGVRPIYWANIDDFLIVSNALWAIEQLEIVPKNPDWIAATEVAAFGYPLTDRTLFRDVRVLVHAQFLSANKHRYQISHYWDWESIAANSLELVYSSDYIHNIFNKTVDDRIQEQRSVLAFLSGGLDSRLIVSRLCENDLKVHSLNCAPDGSQDLVFGAMAAEVLGTSHFEMGQGEGGLADRQIEIVRACWRNHQEPALPANKRLVWAGDGGSVGLGHVYLDDEIIGVARTSSIEGCARTIQNKLHFKVSPKMFIKSQRELADIPFQGIVNDLCSRHKVEPGRNCHLFFMLNDQRRHLHHHYENVHKKRIDFILPFFDGRLVSTIVGSNIDIYLYHNLYNDILMNSEAGTVPWQAYPGHRECPISIPNEYRNQWEDGWCEPKTAKRLKRRELISTIYDILSPSFPSEVLSRYILLAALGSALTGYQKYFFLSEHVKPYIEANLYIKY